VTEKNLVFVFTERTTRMKIVARQGDIVFVRRDKPAGGEKAKPRNGRLVLATGEATGHAHTVDARRAELWTVGGESFLVVSRTGASAEHEEHGPVAFAEGDYEVVRQVEYDGEEERVVAD
jgi:hypothetical protein